MTTSDDRESSLAVSSNIEVPPQAESSHQGNNSENEPPVTLDAATRLLSKAETLIQEEMLRQRKLGREVAQSRPELDPETILSDVIRQDATITGCADVVPALAELLMAQADAGRYPFEQDVVTELERQAWAWSRAQTINALMEAPVANEHSALELESDAEYSAIYSTFSPEESNDDALLQHDQTTLGGESPRESGHPEGQGGDDRRSAGQGSPSGSHENTEGNGRAQGEEPPERAGSLGNVGDEIHASATGSVNIRDRHLRACRFLIQGEVDGDNANVQANEAGARLAFQAALVDHNHIASGRVAIAGTPVIACHIIRSDNDLILFTNDHGNAILGFNADDDLITCDENGVRSCWHGPTYQLASKEPVSLNLERSGVQIQRSSLRSDFMAVAPVTPDQLYIHELRPGSGMASLSAAIDTNIGASEPFAVRTALDRAERDGLTSEMIRHFSVDVDEVGASALESPDLKVLADAFVFARLTSAMVKAELQQRNSLLGTDAKPEAVTSEATAPEHSKSPTPIEIHAQRIAEAVTSDVGTQTAIVDSVRPSLEKLSQGEAAPTLLLLQTGKYVSKAIEVVTGNVGDAPAAMSATERFINPQNPYMVTQPLVDLDLDYTEVLPGLVAVNAEQDVPRRATILATEQGVTYRTYPVPKLSYPSAIGKVQGWAGSEPITPDGAPLYLAMANPSKAVLAISLKQALSLETADLANEPIFNEAMAELAVCVDHSEFGNLRLLGQSAEGHWLYQDEAGARLKVTPETVSKERVITVGADLSKGAYLLTHRVEEDRVATPIDLNTVEWATVRATRARVPVY